MKDLFITCNNSSGHRTIICAEPQFQQGHRKRARWYLHVQWVALQRGTLSSENPNLLHWTVSMYAHYSGGKCYLIFRGYSLRKHSLNNSPEQKQSVPLTTRGEETWENQEEFSPSNIQLHSSKQWVYQKFFSKSHRHHSSFWVFDNQLRNRNKNGVENKTG